MILLLWLPDFCLLKHSLDKFGCHKRSQLSPYWHSDAARGVAFFIHADNIANQQVWMPDLGGNTGDTIPVDRGRTLYFGVELSLGKAGAVNTR